MTDEVLLSVDTITIAALMRAMQVVIHAYQDANQDTEAFDRLETLALNEIKALDTGAFAYEEQAEGLAQGLLLTRSVFRYARAQAEASVDPAGVQPKGRSPRPSAVCAQRN
ncbi:hypothetical protein SLNSH_12185 [Alsobacter soli]|uniref:Uncharacterized protein n=1 Tax=Alsobacter soli TaxID=2109933 RepID=A0A2T1HT61_9HYPH|nr:hypothetical protein [Alsobacter soli]PSC04836.1 hypothetical protein SLNSH_12185 [Alsobacter soli]